MPEHCFVVEAPFAPAGDQPSAIQELTEALVRQGRLSVVQVPAPLWRRLVGMGGG